MSPRLPVSVTLGLFTRLCILTTLWQNLNYLWLKGPSNFAGAIDWSFLVVNALMLLVCANVIEQLDVEKPPAAMTTVVAAGGFR